MITKEEAEKAYADLILLRRSEVLEKDKANPGIIEIHHILPKSCGGLDVPENKVALYAKEHFMAHVYLWIIHRNDKFHLSTTYALIAMCKGTCSGKRQSLKKLINASEEYLLAKCDFSKICSQTIGLKIKGENNGAHGKHWYSNDLKQKSMLFYDTEVPQGWYLGYKYLCRSNIRTIEKQMTRANNIERLKIILDCRIAFFSMYYEYYLKYGFNALCNEYNLVIERTALLHLFKKYVPQYKKYNRWQ